MHIIIFILAIFQFPFCSRTLRVWYSFCLIYNTQTSSLAVNIDGLEALQIKNENNFKDKIVNLKSPLELGNCKSVGMPPLTGQLSDLNIWSRPLNEDEVKEFMELCNSEVVKQFSYNKSFVFQAKLLRIKNLKN